LIVTATGKLVRGVPVGDRGLSAARMTSPDNPGERRRTAYHEAAHCCAAMRLRIPFTVVTIIGGDGTTDHMHRPRSCHSCLDHATMHLAGVVAEARVVGQPVAALVLDVASGDLVAAAKALMRASPPRPTLSEALDRGA
jgi:hypothetical protein